MKKAVHLNNICSRKIPGADEITHGQIDAGDFFSFGGPDDLLMAKLAALAINSVETAGRFVEEGTIGGFRIGVQVRQCLAMRGQ